MALQLIRSGAAPPSAAQIAPVRVYRASLDSPEAQRSMMSCLRRAASLMLGADSELSVAWGTIRFSHVEVLKEAMKEMGYQPATINVTLAAVKGVARAAWLLGNQGLSGEDYQRIAAVRGVRGTRDHRGRALSADELTALLRACERDPTAAGPRDACLLALMCRGGLRRAECVVALLSDFDRRSHSLKVKGKGDRQRMIYFRQGGRAGGALRALLAWLRARGEEEGALLCPVDKAGRVSIRGLSPQAVYQALRKRARQAGLRREVSPHDLRRTCASELLERGSDISVVRQVLGHASVETTTIYDCRPERAKREAMELLPLSYRSPRGARRGRRSRRP